ncbi:ribonuclease HIII [Spiroplasma endosymbiont of Labia minor]|uniref:ribonuclease HIII n=1 Tax=Spiroplasma endosymbiont of Labia minor TaxID=3066305 RepID=UPI0030D1213C
MVSQSFKNVDKKIINNIRKDFNINDNIMSFNFNGGKVTLYKNNTVLIQGSNIEWFLIKYFDFEVEKIPTTDVIGCDETGVGDYFGPLVSACAYVSSEHIADYPNLFAEVTDSKKLSDVTVVVLAEKLREIIPFRIQVMQNLIYNELQVLYKNAHALKALIHNKCLQKFLHNYPNLIDKKIVIDEFTSKGNYYKFLRNAHADPIKNTFFLPKAEVKVIAVAVASILARAELLNQMQKLEAEFNITLPFGANNNVKQLVKKYKLQFPVNIQEQFIKIHFKI